MDMRKVFVASALAGLLAASAGCSVGPDCFDQSNEDGDRFSYSSSWCAETRAGLLPTCYDSTIKPPDSSYRPPPIDSVQCATWRKWAETVCLDPNDRMYNSEACVWARDYFEKHPSLLDGGVDPDAGSEGGSDAGGDAGGDAASARNNDHCVPNHPDHFASPQPVWFGPIEQAPKECASDVGAFGGRGYFDLHKPTSEGCPACACGKIDGYCPTQIGGIQFRSGICEESNVITTDFSAPDGWDGSCTANNSIDQDAECPASSGTKCFQSIHAAALPDPVQGCKPLEIPVPKAITDPPKWKQSALSCTPRLEHGATADDVCISFPKASGWRTCVHSSFLGEQECHSDSKYTDRIVVYPEKAIIDHRSCSACECETSGGICYGSLRYYADNNCTTAPKVLGLSSQKSECDNVYPPGAAVGSKDLGEFFYVPGTCTPKGGVPIGDIELDTTNAVTWCCLAKEPEDEK